MGSTMVHARVDEELKNTVTEILGNMGLTTSDVVRMLFTNIAANRSLPQGLAVDPVAYDTWFRAKVQEALDSVAAGNVLSHEEVEAEAAQWRKEIMAKMAASS